MNIEGARQIAADLLNSVFVRRERDGVLYNDVLREDIAQTLLASSNSPPGFVRIGVLPKTGDGVEFGLGANIWATGPEHDDVLSPCGVLSITDPDGGNEDDYPQGQRWVICVRNTTGYDFECFEGDCYSSKQAALKAAEGKKS